MDELVDTKDNFVSHRTFALLGRYSRKEGKLVAQGKHWKHGTLVETQLFFARKTTHNFLPHFHISIYIKISYTCIEITCTIDCPNVRDVENRKERRNGKERPPKKWRISGEGNKKQKRGRKVRKILGQEITRPLPNFARESLKPMRSRGVSDQDLLGVREVKS